MADKMEQNKSELTKKDNGVMALKYLLCTSGAGLIQVISFTLLNTVLHFDGLQIFMSLFNLAPGDELKYGPSYFVALMLSVIFNFTVNRKFTFKSANNIPIAMLKVIGYYCVFTPASIWWGEALAQIGWNEFLILALTMFINLVTEFTFTRFVVFGKSINTAEKKAVEDSK